MNKILLLLVFGVYLQPLIAQNTQNDRAEANKLLRESRRLRVEGAFQTSNDRLQNAIRLYQAMEMWGKYCTAKSLLSSNYEQLGNKEKVEQLQEEIVVTSVKYLGKNNRFELQAYIKLGELSYQKEAYAVALRYLDEAASLIKRKPAGNEDLKTEIFSLKAAMLAASGKRAEALSTYALANQSASKKPLPELPVLARFYQGYAQTLFRDGQVEAALLQAQKSKGLHQSLYGNKDSKTVRAHTLVIDILAEKGQITMALQAINNLLAVISDQPELQAGTVELLLKKGELSLKKKDVATAKMAIDQAIEKARSVLGSKHILLARSYHVQAKIALAEADSPKALAALDKALLACYPFSDQLPTACTELTLDPFLVLELKLAKQKELYQQALKTKSDANKLAATLIKYNCVNEQLLLELNFEQESQHITTLQRQVVEMNVAQLMQLYSSTQADQLLQKMSFWVHYAKWWERAALLNYGGLERNNTSLSDSLWLEKVAIQKALSSLRKAINKGHEASNEMLQRRWRRLQQQQKAWLQKVKTQFPDYHAYFHQMPAWDVQAYTQKLAEKQGHLNFILAQGQLYVLVVQGQRLSAYSISNVASLRQKVEQWKKLLSIPKETKTAHELTHVIYTQLLGPLNWNLAEISTLYITTDQFLDDLPFEALRTIEDKYLIEYFPIHYLYQPSELLEPQQAEGKDLLFINSSYLNQPLKGEDIGWYEKASDWSGNRTLGNKYRRFFQGDYWLNYQVSADHLKTAEVANYGIIHLALYHALAKDPEPQNGWLMNYESDTLATLFSINDMMEMSLDAGLVTLAIGNGDSASWKSLRQMNAALRFAGATATMWPRWQVKEYYNRYLIQTFYKKLAEGLPKAKAMQEARLTLINKRKYTSPHYWANLRLEGVNATIQIQSKFRFPWLFVGVGVGVMVLIIGAWARWGRG